MPLTVRLGQLTGHQPRLVTPMTSAKHLQTQVVEVCLAHSAVLVQVEVVDDGPGHEVLERALDGYRLTHLVGRQCPAPVLVELVELLAQLPAPSTKTKLLTRNRL